MEAFREAGRLTFGEVQEVSPGAHGGTADAKTVRGDLEEHIARGRIRFEPPAGPGFRGEYVDVGHEATAILGRWLQAEGVLQILGPPGRALRGLNYASASWALRWKRQLEPLFLEALTWGARAGRLPKDCRPGRPSWTGERWRVEVDGQEKFLPLLEAMEADPPPETPQDLQLRLLFTWLEGG